MGILEEQLLNEIDEILYESYPPIFLELEKRYKDDISKLFYIGPNSKQKKITREEAIKVPYSNGLIVVVDENYKPKFAMVGAKIIKVGNFYWYGALNRKKVLDKYSNIFYISPDKESLETIKKRESRPLNYEFDTKEIQGRIGSDNFKKLIDKYKIKKNEEIIKLLPKIKNTLKKLLEKSNDEFYKQIENSTNPNLELEYTEDFERLSERLTSVLINIERINQYDGINPERLSRKVLNITSKLDVIKRIIENNK